MEQQNNNQNNGQNQVVTWPIVNTLLQDHFDQIRSMVKELYAAASEHTARTENLSKENKELQDRVIKLEEEKKQLLLDCDALNAEIKSLNAIALPQPQVENMD